MVAETLPPQIICTVLTFVASQTLDIVSTIQVLQLVTIVNDDFDGTQQYFDDDDNFDVKL